jgi:septal ring factor EnvC (AmiA/AmiB activator)
MNIVYRYFFIVLCFFCMSFQDIASKDIKNIKHEISQLTKKIDQKQKEITQSDEQITALQEQKSNIEKSRDHNKQAQLVKIQKSIDKIVQTTSNLKKEIGSLLAQEVLYQNKLMPPHKPHFTVVNTIADQSFQAVTRSQSPLYNRR